MPRGSLLVVGTGLVALRDLTTGARSSIAAADDVFYLVSDDLTREYVERINPKAVDLSACYSEGKPRIDSYQEMIDLILAAVREDRKVCAVFYGHPGVFVYPSHRAVSLAREAGYHAQMLPAPSAEDYLFADLGIDPARSGCQSYEATDFLLRPRSFDPTTLLVLWQVGVIGHLDFHRRGYDNVHVDLLVETLSEVYPHDHEVVIYEASAFPLVEPRIEPVPLADLAMAQLTGISTLVVPAVHRAPFDPDRMQRLGLALEDIPHAPTDGWALSALR